MSLLAAPKFRVKLSDNPNGKLWAENKNNLGKKMLSKMGWSEGMGLGKEEQGMKDAIKIQKKFDTRGIGCSNEHAMHISLRDDVYANTPAELLQVVDSPIVIPEEGALMGLEEHSRASRSRLHYSKFTRAKDVSRYSDKELACIFGRPPPSSDGDSKDDKDTEDQNGDSDYGVNIIRSGLTMSEYFQMKMSKKSSDNENMVTDCNGSEPSSSQQQVEVADMSEIRSKKKRKEGKGSNAVQEEHEEIENSTNETTHLDNEQSLSLRDLDDGKNKKKKRKKEKDSAMKKLTKECSKNTEVVVEDGVPVTKPLEVPLEAGSCPTTVVACAVESESSASSPADDTSPVEPPQKRKKIRKSYARNQKSIDYDLSVFKSSNLSQLTGYPYY